MAANRALAPSLPESVVPEVPGRDGNVHLEDHGQALRAIVAIWLPARCLALMVAFLSRATAGLIAPSAPGWLVARCTAWTVALISRAASRPYLIVADAVVPEARS